MPTRRNWTSSVCVATVMCLFGSISLSSTSGGPRVAAVVGEVPSDGAGANAIWANALVTTLMSATTLTRAGTDVETSCADFVVVFNAGANVFFFLFNCIGIKGPNSRGSERTAYHFG